MGFYKSEGDLTYASVDYRYAETEPLTQANLRVKIHHVNGLPSYSLPAETKDGHWVFP